MANALQCTSQVRCQCHAGLEDARGQLERVACQLSAIRADLEEAYSMLAKAGLDFARERQEKEAAQRRCAELEAEAEGHRERCWQLAQALEARESCRPAVQQPAHEALSSCHVDAARLLNKACAGGDLGAPPQGPCTAQYGLLEQGLAEALVGMAVKVNGAVAQERKRRRDAEAVAMATVQSLWQVMEEVRGERESLQREREDMEEALRWNRCSLRQKMEEAQEVVVQRMEMLEEVERVLARRAAERGLGPLWTADEDFFHQTLDSCREPLGEGHAVEREDMQDKGQNVNASAPRDHHAPCHHCVPAGNTLNNATNNTPVSNAQCSASWGHCNASNEQSSLDNSPRGHGSTLPCEGNGTRSVGHQLAPSATCPEGSSSGWGPIPDAIGATPGKSVLHNFMQKQAPEDAPEAAPKKRRLLHVDSSPEWSPALGPSLVPHLMGHEVLPSLLACVNSSTLNS